LSVRVIHSKTRFKKNNVDTSEKCQNCDGPKNLIYQIMNSEFWIIFIFYSCIIRSSVFK